MFWHKKRKKNPFPHIFDSENLSGLIWSCSWLHPLSSNSVPSFSVSPPNLTPLLGGPRKVLTALLPELQSQICLILLPSIPLPFYRDNLCRQPHDEQPTGEIKPSQNPQFPLLGGLGCKPAKLEQSESPLKLPLLLPWVIISLNPLVQIKPQSLFLTLLITLALQLRPGSASLLWERRFL